MGNVVSAAEDVIYQRIDLLTRLEESADFRRIIRKILGPSWGRAMPGQTGHLPGTITDHIRGAADYHVTDNACTLIERAADRLRDDDTYDESVTRTPAGFVRFDRPIRILDVWGKEMATHVMTWGPLRVVRPWDQDRVIKDGYVTRDNVESTYNATMLTMWNDIDIEPDHYSRRALAEVGEESFRGVCGRWSLIGAELLPDGAPVGPRIIDPRKVFGDRQDETRPYGNTYRPAVAMFDLMNQTVVSAETERVPRHARRRASRAGIDAGDVTVVALRRRSSSAGHRESSGEPVDWSCRWVVDGHWHRYRTGPGRRDVVRRWVGDYVKGPEDKPLVFKKKVYELRR